MQPSGTDDSVVSLTHHAARRLRLISRGHISADVRAKVSLCVVDIIAAAQYGLDSEVAGSLRQYAKLHGGAPEATAFGCSSKVDAGTAAFVNGAMAHSPIRDDMHLPSVAHLGSMVITAALALSERENWSGEQLLRAIVGGYEMGAALGTAVHASGKANTHLRSSGLIGAFAAASAAVCGQDTDEDTIVNALCIAINQACGFNQWAWSAGWELPLQNGMAARAGIFAYDLALTGIRASDTVLEGQAGFFQAIGVGSEGADALRQWLQTPVLGRGILDVKFKPMGCCNFTQTSTAIAVKLAQRSTLVASDVKEIVVTTTSAAIRYPGCDNPSPIRNAIQGKLSIQYGISAALALSHMEEEAWNLGNRDDIGAMMSKCTLTASQRNDELFRQGLQPAKVELFMKDGSVVQEEAGDVPWLSSAEVIDRFLKDMQSFGEEDRVRRLLWDCQHLEDLNSCRDLLQS